MKQTFIEYLIEAKHHGFRTPDATDFEVGKNVRGNTIRRGMVLAMKYPSGGNVFVEVKGFTDNKSKYGENGVAYNSIKEVLRANNVSNLKELDDQDQDNEYGYHHYMVLHDLTHDVITIKDNIFNVYLYQGRWCVGSSAERVSFYEARYVPSNKITEARYHGNSILSVETFDDYHNIEARSDDLYEKIGRPVTDEELGFIEGMPGHYGYFGLFYTDNKPSRTKILSMVEKVLSEMHPDPKASNFAECIADYGSVYYDNPTPSGHREGVKPKLYCDDYD